MTLYGSLQLSHGLGLCRNQGYYNPQDSAITRRLGIISMGPLSFGVPLGQYGFRNILLSDYLRRPISSVPCRATAFRCHSFYAGVKFIEPPIRAATMVLTKSHGLIQQFPLVYKLVPSVALLGFSLWGIVPLVRQGRNLLLNKKNDNGWKKSGTYRVMTSYVQPLLLWLGALFICRALDPVVLPTEASKIVKDRLLNFVRSLSTVLAFAYCISSLIQQTQKLFSETSDPNDARNMGFQFAGKAVYSAVWVAAVALFMELLGFSTHKWLTAGGLGTVLITLTGREILISCFVKTSHREEYLSVKEAILLDLLRVISHHRARLATPIRTIRKMHTAADMETAPFGESMYGPGGVAASRRSSVVIEPSYKIYGEEKSKSQKRASKPSTAEQEDNSPKSKETPSSDSKAVSDTNKVPDETVVKPGTKPVSRPKSTAGVFGDEKPKTKRSGNTTKSSSPKKETDGSTSSVSRSAVEENLVLGVALEGSKRTLPIDEEEIRSSTKEADAKELTGAARRSGKRPLVVDKEKKDGQSQTDASTEL